MWGYKYISHPQTSRNPQGLRIELIEPVSGGGYRTVILGDIGTRRKGGEAGGACTWEDKLVCQ